MLPIIPYHLLLKSHCRLLYVISPPPFSLSTLISLPPSTFISLPPSSLISLPSFSDDTFKVILTISGTNACKRIHAVIVSRWAIHLIIIPIILTLSLKIDENEIRPMFDLTKTFLTTSKAKPNQLCMPYQTLLVKMFIPIHFSYFSDTVYYWMKVFLGFSKVWGFSWWGSASLVVRDFNEV